MIITGHIHKGNATPKQWSALRNMIKVVRTIAISNGDHLLTRRAEVFLRNTEYLDVEGF